MNDLDTILGRIEFKDGWWLRTGRDENAYWLQWCFNAPCIVTGEMQEQRGRKWRISTHSTDGEVVQTAFAAALMAAEHEVREDFTYRGARIFGPHLDIEAMVEVSEKTVIREDNNPGFAEVV